MDATYRIIYYIQTNVACIAILLGVLFLLRRTAEVLPVRKRTFGCLVLTAILLCAADLFAGAFRGMDFPGARVILWISNILYSETLVVSCYIWMIYVNIRLHGEQTAFRKRFLFLALPLVALTALLVTTPWTKLLFTIDENNLYDRAGGGGMIVFWVCTWAYAVIPTIQSFYHIRKTKSATKRQEFYPLVSFLIPAIVCAVLQVFVYGISAIGFGMTASILLVYVTTSVSQISTDELTGLSNRRKLRAYAELQCGGETMGYVLMLDLNGFKEINDTLGHAFGDVALIETANVLKTACAVMHSDVLLCRYGGDEFVIVGFNRDPGEIETLKTAIREGIAEANRAPGKKYEISISIGSAYGHCTDMEDMDHLFRVADEAMYDEKRKR